MADNLPLIPGKSNKVCSDVKPVLRQVFQKLDVLPPLATEGRDNAGGSGDNQTDEKWIEDLKTECEEILNKEGELKQQYAKRLARDPLPNIYKLHEKIKSPEVKRDRFRCQHDKTKEEIEERRNQERKKQEIIQKRILEKKNQAMKIQRGDLMPTVAQNADGEERLWIKNILNRSSGDLSTVEIRGSRIHPPIHLTPNSYTEQSLSIGEVVMRPAMPPPPEPPSPPPPEYIICIPPQLDFVNFTVGRLHTKILRLVNVSKFEVRLSVRPPERRELDVEISGQRGLTLTAGADTQLRIHFRPREVRALRDELAVRVSAGRALRVPIACYMQPPMLHILVPSVSSSAFFCTPDGGKESTTIARGSDVIDLGARLLGDVHSVQLLFHCDADHVAFFVLTEDAWLSFSLEELSTCGSMVSEGFVLWPAWWRGGGAVRARAWCRAARAGLHALALRVLASTAVARPLHLLADSLYYNHDHLIIEAHERDYDICSEDDPACQYYVHLGTAFPNRSLCATVQLINRSPVTYSFYWSIRPWGVCSCWDESLEDLVGLEMDSEELCVGAKERRRKEREGRLSVQPLEHTTLVHVEPAHGTVTPRSALALHVRAPDAGTAPGTRRAVLMLVLKDIPKESFPKDFDPMIVRTSTVNSDPIPGVKGWTREVCEVVCAQMEVWWEVVPVRFVVDPPVIPIIHSRRVERVRLSLRATQLLGSEHVQGAWRAPPHVALPPATLLSPAHSHMVHVDYTLPALPNDYPETDIITLKAANDEWQFSCAVTRSCVTRHPALVAPRAPLGVVRPGADMTTTLTIVNDTHQHICWWATAYRWTGERAPAAACVGRVPCTDCGERACACALLAPTRGALKPGEEKEIKYRVVAPDSDGCVATLIQARRTGADVARGPGGAGSAARASLVTYRVLAPRLALRALPCCTHTSCNCTGCQLDPGAGTSASGTATLRPLGSLTLHQRTCYRLRVTNFTPIPTRVKWDDHLENDILKVMFVPNEFDVEGYGNVEIKVVVEAVKVCGRRVFVVRASVQHAYRPLYLLIDAAISGLEVVCEIPIGGEETTCSKLIMKMIQREEYPWEVGQPKPNTPEDIFAEWDRTRARAADSECRCSHSMEHLPPPPAPPPGPAVPPTVDDSSPSAEIVREPPTLTAVCKCFQKMSPIIPKHEESLCVQFQRLPLHTVRSRTITLRNVSALTARWSAVVRRWPRVHNKGLTAPKDEWSRDVSGPGVIVQCRPRSGQLLARTSLQLQLEVYADCWGLYRDQLLLEVENLPPVVIDVWVEAVGSPLLFALTVPDAEAVPVVWLSPSDRDRDRDPERVVRVRNVSRSALTLHTYVVAEHEHVQDELPLRLYLRFYDASPRTCSCDTASQELSSVAGEGSVEAEPELADDEPGTMVELYLAADYGAQCDHYYQVWPRAATVSAGAWHEWRVSLRAPRRGDLAPPPPSAMLLRPVALDYSGPSWYRGPVPPAVARLRLAPRASCLRLSCRELRVQLCALHLPLHDVMRVRKRFQISNVGSLRTVVQPRVAEPWAVVQAAGRGACGAEGCRRGGDLTLDLLPRTSQEMCVEVSVPTMSVWPASVELPCGPRGGPCEPNGPGEPNGSPHYPTHTRTVTKLFFYDNDNLLLTLPLVLELEFPAVRVEPALIDFGFVTDGDTRKSYFTVTHSSRTETVALVSEWVGPEEFRVWPRRLALAPGVAARFYVQYTARWRTAPVEGYARVSAGGGAGAWCRAGARARGVPARDLGAARPPHDYTDDAHLLPPALAAAAAVPSHTCPLPL